MTPLESILSKRALLFSNTDYHVPNNNFDDILHELSQAQTREDS